MQSRAGPKDIVPRAKFELRPPEGLIRLAECVSPRDANILQEVIVVGDVTQRHPCAPAREPAGNYAAAATDPSDGAFLARAQNARGGAQ